MSIFAFIIIYRVKSALHSEASKSSAVRKSVHWQTPDWKNVSLPILEKGRVPNRVELTQLSDRIRDKLKPTRDELLHKRSHDVQPDITVCKPIIYSLENYFNMYATRKWINNSSNPVNSFLLEIP